MQIKWTAPSRDTRAAAPSVSLRNPRKASSVISPEAICELAVATFGVGVTANADVIGRVEEGGIDGGAFVVRPDNGWASYSAQRSRQRVSDAD
jgi:hypothetical protein